MKKTPFLALFTIACALTVVLSGCETSKNSSTAKPSPTPNPVNKRVRHKRAVVGMSDILSAPVVREIS